MSLIKCLRKIGSFTKEEQDYFLKKAVSLQDTEGLSQKEAENKVVEELKNDLSRSLISIYKQAGIDTTKEVKSLSDASKGLKPMRIAYKKGTTTIEQEDLIAYQRMRGRNIKR